MRTEQLRYLIEISRHSSMRAASEKLYLSPQALSMSIDKLENELGLTLLKRTNQGVSLTEDGQWLVELSNKFLDAIDERLESKSKSQARRRGELVVYTQHLGMGNTVFPQLILSLAKSEPDFRLELRELDKGELCDQVAKGLVECGYIYRTFYISDYVDAIPENTTFEPLFDGHLCAMVSPDHELAQFESTSLKRLSEYPISAFGSTKEDLRFLMALLDNKKGDPGSLTLESNYETFRYKLLFGDSINISIINDIDETPLNYIDGLKVVRIRDKCITSLGLIRQNERTLSENAGYFLRELQALISQRIASVRNTQHAES